MREEEWIVEIGVGECLGGFSHDELVIVGTLVVRAVVLRSDTVHNKCIKRAALSSRPDKKWDKS